MEKEHITTSIGEIAVHTKGKINSTESPIIFLHGLYFDHNLWENQIPNISDRTVIAVDMPDHGESKNGIKKEWDLDDCANMLIEILNYMKVNKVIAVGHSWGSMTILRAANKKPNLFQSVVFCNMPFMASTAQRKMIVRLQHSLLVFKKFYMNQAGKALISQASLKKNPELIKKLTDPMSKLSIRQIIHADKAVILDSINMEDIIKNIQVPAIAVVGVDDYLTKPPMKRVIEVKGGHISPLEDPDTTSKIIRQALGL